MGCSCDWERQAFTMDEPRAKAVREAFFRLFKDGLIYRGKRLVNWDPATQTALADDEVEMEEIDGHFYYLRYPIVDDALLHVAPRPVLRAEGGVRALRRPNLENTSRSRPRAPKRCSATPPSPSIRKTRAPQNCAAKSPPPHRQPHHPDHRGRLRRPPRPERRGSQSQFATGFLKVTPAHDPNDYDIGQRHNLPMINVLAPDGTISDSTAGRDKGDAGFACSASTASKRASAVVEWFRRNNLLEEVKPYRHSVGHSYRSHVPIEPYLSDQWYCKVTDDRWPARPCARWRRTNGTSGTGILPVLTASKTDPSPSQTLQHGRDAHATKAGVGRPTPLLPRALRQDVPDLAREHPRLVHQPAAVVGASDSGVASCRKARCSTFGAD
jgi:valyl-tRNA synthetase